MSVHKPSIAKKQIRELKQGLALLMDENSPRSRELKEMEVLKKKADADRIGYFSKLAEKLSAPDTEYFEKYIKEQETKLFEYINSIGKRKSKQPAS